MVIRHTSVSEMASKIDAIRKKRDQFNNRLQTLENQLKEKERKELTKKKILIGSFVIDTLEKSGKVSEINNETLIKVMDQYLTKKSDRELFNLSPHMDFNNSDSQPISDSRNPEYAAEKIETPEEALA